jgi:hypothetical protein
MPKHNKQGAEPPHKKPLREEIAQDYNLDRDDDIPGDEDRDGDTPPPPHPRARRPNNSSD